MGGVSSAGAITAGQHKMQAPPAMVPMPLPGRVGQRQLSGGATIVSTATTLATDIGVPRHQTSGTSGSSMMGDQQVPHQPMMRRTNSSTNSLSSGNSIANFSTAEIAELPEMPLTNSLTDLASLVDEARKAPMQDWR
eukprot:COSAG01_NODE_6782_length_3501_cov_2.333627_1_plen_137_part_00